MLIPFSDRFDRERDAIKKFENYQPVVNIQYTDKFGRTLDEKEAFRLLSHKFHGKGPGKKNTEKDLRRIEAEMKQKKGDSDSFLTSVNALEQRQKSLGQAGIVIQVGNKQ
jgi:U4/U6.U5 tri-snRNP-associated protein 1